MEFDFATNTVVDSLEKVPADFRGLYVEADGKHKLNSDDATVGSAVKAIVGLNKALTASRAEARDAKGRVIDLSPLSEYGTDPTAIATAVSAAVEEAKKANKGKQNEDVATAVKSAQEAMAAAHQKDLAGVNTRNEALTGQLYGLMVNAEATTALAAASAINPALVLPFIEKQVKVEENDGKFVVKVVDGDGNDRFSGTTGTHMTIKELVSEMKGAESYQPLFKSESHSGGGRPPTHQPGRAGAPKGELSATQKIAQGLAKGQAVQE